MIHVGIDPGKTGAIALLDDGRLVAVDDMPVIGGQVSATILALRLPFTVLHATVERVAARPGQGVSSTFTFGFSAGVVHGVLGALRIPVDAATPSTWKRHFRLGADKDEARARAIERWPVHADQFARKRDDGRAEAALIALWWHETQRDGRA